MEKQNPISGETPTGHTKRTIDYQSLFTNATKGRRWLYAVATFGVVLAIVLKGALVAVSVKTDKHQNLPPLKLPAVSAPAPAPAPEPDYRGIARNRLQPDLDWAERQSAKSVDDHLQQLDEFFAEAKKRSPRFAQDALGWRSKWYLIVDKLPRTRKDRQPQFLAKSFNDDIFSPEQLTQVLDQLVKDCVNSELGIENEMLVKMRADVSDLPPAVLIAFTSKSELRAAFERALVEARQRAGVDLKADVGREITSAVVAQVLSWVAVRMAVEGGILGAGASTSWGTLGISLGVAIIVDQIVTRIWDWYRDPVGELTRKINDKLDDVRRLIVEGDGRNSGLRARLKDLSKTRSALRRAAMDQILTLSKENKP
jgi:hypothetical protein